MHPSAMNNGRNFFRTYAEGFSGQDGVRIVDIGSLAVGGSLREVAPPQFEYVGVDLEPGKGVDVVTEDPYSFPLEDNSFDIAVSTSCFEHSEMFWLLFLDIMRILKPKGLLYMNVPSNGYFHPHPVDCWRFFPDAGRALLTWGERNELQPALLESWVSSRQGNRPWNDFVAVYLKDKNFAEHFPNRICQNAHGLSNVLVHGSDQVFDRDTNFAEGRFFSLRTLRRQVRRSWRGLTGKSEASEFLSGES